MVDARLFPLAMSDRDAFAERLVGEGLAPSTIRNYLGKLDYAQGWCQRRGLTLAHLSVFETAELADSLPYAYSSRAHLRNTLGRYWNLVDRPDPPTGAVRVPPKPQGECRAVTRDEARLLAKAALDWYPEGLAVLIGMYLALRASEIAAWRWDRYDAARAQYRKVGKRGKMKWLPVHPVLADQLDQARRHCDTGRFLFPGHRGRQHVTYQTVWNWVKTVCGAAGVLPIQPHQIRHTALATSHDNTGNLRATADLADHTSIETTRIYTRTTAEALWEAVMALDYLD